MAVRVRGDGEVPLADVLADPGPGDVADGELLAWASGLSGERLWALEDCRQLTRALERWLTEAAEQQVRVPPKLIAPERRAGRARGKSDPTLKASSALT